MQARSGPRVWRASKVKQALRQGVCRVIAWLSVCRFSAVSRPRVQV